MRVCDSVKYIIQAFLKTAVRWRKKLNYVEETKQGDFILLQMCVLNRA